MESRIVLICGILALLARVGMALWSTGLVRAKNSAGIVLRHVVDLAITMIAVYGVWAVGSAVATHGGSGTHRWLDTPQLLGGHAGPGPSTLFYWICIIPLGTGILPGVLAERSRFFANAWGTLLLAAIGIPVVDSWVNANGWLGRCGYHDFAGATMLHLSCGLFAAVGAIIVGPRLGKFNKDGSSNAIPGHSVPLATIGALLIFVGWVPYLLGSSMSVPEPLVKVVTVNDNKIAQIALNVLLAGSAGALAGMFFSYWRYTKADVYFTFAGLLGALVAITAGADDLPGWGALLLGAAAGLLVPYLTIALDLRFRLDDPTGAVAVHVGGAVLGLLVTPFFRPGLLGDRLMLFLVTVLGILVTSLFMLIMGCVFFGMFKQRRTLRSKEADEFEGLDLAEHDIGSYPDFQQNMIKSYHLREA